MSFIKKAAPPSATCECLREQQKGTFRMSVVPMSTDVRDSATHDETVQLMNAERIQDMFLPSLLKVPVHAHGKGFHVHPEQPGSVAHVAQLHDLMDEHNLTVRIGLATHGDERSVATSLDRNHVEELLANNIVDVDVPLDGGTFRLHSNQPGRITAVEYVAQ
jgi:hypothetical protein